MKILARFAVKVDRQAQPIGASAATGAAVAHARRLPLSTWRLGLLVAVATRVSAAFVNDVYQWRLPSLAAENRDRDAGL